MGDGYNGGAERTNNTNERVRRMGTYVIMRVWRNNPQAKAYEGTIEAASPADAEHDAASRWPLEGDCYHDAYHIHEHAREIESLLTRSELQDAGWPA